MRYRAEASGIHLNAQDAAIVKGMLARGDRQHDIAAWFGVNAGRIGEIATGKSFRGIGPAGTADLPPPGPYPSGKQAAVIIKALDQAKAALDAAEKLVRSLH